MNRRECISTGLAAVAVACLPIPANATEVEKKLPLRRVWKWCSTSNQWIVVRMECLRKGDIYSIEAQAGSKYRIISTAIENPKYGVDGYKGWSIKTNVNNARYESTTGEKCTKEMFLDEHNKYL